MTFARWSHALFRACCLRSTIHHLERRGVDCPKALITTHFHELFQMGLLKESNTISFWVRRRPGLFALCSRIVAAPNSLLLLLCL